MEVKNKALMLVIDIEKLEETHYSNLIRSLWKVEKNKSPLILIYSCIPVFGIAQSGKVQRLPYFDASSKETLIGATVGIKRYNNRCYLPIVDGEDLDAQTCSSGTYI